MSSPPKPARRVSFIRYSFRRTRRTFSTMIRLSFRLTFASAGISRHLFQDNLEVHGVLVPWTAAAVRPRTEAFRRCALMSVDHADDHGIGILFPCELRVRDGALEDLEERLCCLHRIPGGPGAGLVRDPPIVFLHWHRLLQGDHLFEVFAGLVDGLPAELSGELDRLLPCERQFPTVCSGHRLDLVFDRVPELRHSTPHFSGMNFDDRVAPTPGPLCVTGLRVIANSPMKWPIISGLISTVTNSFPLWIATFLPMKSGRIGTSRQCVRTASSVPFARTFSTKVRRSSSMPRMNERRGRAGKSSMISSRVIAFISSSV